MGFNIGKALGAAADVVTRPFKNEDDQPARTERTKTASTSSPRSSTSPDSAPESGEPLSSSERNPFARPAAEGDRFESNLLNKAGDFIGGLFGGDDDEEEEKPDKPDGPTVAVIDDFNVDPAGGVNHGAAVEDVITRNSDAKKEDVQRIQQNSSIEPQAQDLDGMIEEYGSALLERTTTSLDQIAKDKDSDVRTVNISQSTSQADVINGLLHTMSPEEVAAELGLPPDTDPHVAQALTDRVNQVYTSSDQIEAARNDYNEVTDTLSDRGVTTVVAAGNSGESVQFLEDNGLTIDESTIGDNALANDDVVVVGAADENGIAPFSSSNGDVNVTADGTGVETDQGPQDGTSFSAPQVAAAIAQMKAANPDLGNAEIMAILEESSSDTEASDDLEGSGFLNTQHVVAQAQAQYDTDEAERVRKAKKDSGAENAGEAVRNVVDGIFGLVA